MWRVSVIGRRKETSWWHYRDAGNCGAVAVGLVIPFIYFSRSVAASQQESRLLIRCRASMSENSVLTGNLNIMIVF